MAERSCHKLIIDVDTGVDDAHAIMLALSSEAVDVLAITCVNGNAGLKSVCRNTLRVLSAWGRLDIPVFPGSDKPLVEAAIDAPYHGSDGLGGVDWSSEMDDSLLQTEHAAIALVRLVNDNKGKITLVALAPLTNIALAMRLDPNFSSKLKSLYIMGGNIKGIGNLTVSGEYNFAADPEAAYAVLRDAHCPINLLPWEPCVDTVLPWDFYEKWSLLDSPKAAFVRKITAHSVERSKLIKRAGFYSCDLWTMAAVLAPESVLESVLSYATVELHGQLTRGQMVVDWNGVLGKAPQVNIIRKLNLQLLEKQMTLMVQ